MLGYGRAIRTLKEWQGGRLRGSLIEIVGDSQAAAAIFRRGGSQRADAESGELELHEAFLDIYEAAAEGGFEVVFRWVPRALLKDADALSKYVDHHDFSLRPEVFERVRRELGPWSIDRFAAAHNYKARFFNALFRTPGSCGADAFAFTWSGGVSYVLPPFPLIDRVLDKIERDDAEAVVVVPAWRSASFWRRVHSGAWQRRLARPALLLDVDALVANPANADDCFFGDSFGSQLLAFRTMPLLGDARRETPALATGAFSFEPAVGGGPGTPVAASASIDEIAPLGAPAEPRREGREDAPAQGTRRTRRSSRPGRASQGKRQRRGS
jgi:hypothetical protein